MIQISSAMNDCEHGVKLTQVWPFCSQTVWRSPGWVTSLQLSWLACWLVWQQCSPCGAMVNVSSSGWDDSHTEVSLPWTDYEIKDLANSKQTFRNVCVYIYFTYVHYTLLTVEKNKVVLCRCCSTIAFKMFLFENYFKPLDVLQEFI